jgi:hypothetical protein
VLFRSCGYLQQRVIAPDVVRTLWHEGACYHVREHNHGEHVRNFWYSTGSLTNARSVLRARDPAARVAALGGVL